MTKFDRISGHGEAKENPKTGQPFLSYPCKKTYFCLPAVAASESLKKNVCASQSFIPSTSSLNSAVPSGQSLAHPPCRTGKKKRKRRGKPTPFYRGICYGSISEAAFGILLEELIPGFSVKEGRTFQLPLGQGRTVDFLIDNTLVEFHFPRSHSRGSDLGDFKDHKERNTFLKSLSRVGRNRHQRKKLLRATHEQLIRNYTAKRRKQIDLSVYGPHTELIVASTPEEFYWKVICRFAGIDVISEKSFVERFEQYCKFVIVTTREAWKEAA